MISSALKDDQGRYQCSAKNLAASRDTRPVRLKIHGEKEDKIIPSSVVCS